MAELLPTPVLQFIDPNGAPYALGNLATYVPGTSTPKTTWSDSGATSANTNPIALDDAGSCVCYGDGAYRLILTDANGAQVFDLESTTLVSVAMAPVVIAPDLASARDAMGITAAINAEAAARVSADNAEAAARAAADTAETTRAEAAEAANAAAIAAETARAEAAEAAISGTVGTFKTGNAVSDGFGNFTVTFPSAFPTSVFAVVCQPIATIGAWVELSAPATTTGFSGRTLSPDAGGDWSLGGLHFYWLATGN
jgi:hypothetical protein